MIATFPLRKSYILKGTLFAMTFFTVIAAHLIAPFVLDLSEGERVALMVMAWGPCLVVYGGMFLMSIYILVAGMRMRVVIQDQRVSDIGVFLRKEFVLADVTLARWNKRRPRLQISIPRGNVGFDFKVHRWDDARQLIRFFRDGIPPEIQEGWTPEWQELASSRESTPAPHHQIPLSKFVRLCIIAGVGAGFLCGIIVHFMFTGLQVTPVSWSGWLSVDWTVYGFATGLAFSVPLIVLLGLERWGAWLDR